jgi:hypothetical protein
LTPEKLSKAQIVQLSAVKDNGVTFNVFIHPTVQIQNDATKYHGIIKGQDGCPYKLAPGAFENPSEENDFGDNTIALNFFLLLALQGPYSIFFYFLHNL